MGLCELDVGGERSGEEAGMDGREGVDKAGDGEGSSTLGVRGIRELPERWKRALIASAKASVGSRGVPKGVLFGAVEGTDGDMGRCRC